MIQYEGNITLDGVSEATVTAAIFDVAAQHIMAYVPSLLYDAVTSDKEFSLTLKKIEM
jgi:hypothetical protein|tara:strand:+ start:395 stop:568 length:174 start_codon:yes stop_codon:yes gene_type:complete